MNINRRTTVQNIKEEGADDLKIHPTLFCCVYYFSGCWQWNYCKATPKRNILEVVWTDTFVLCTHSSIVKDIWN